MASDKGDKGKLEINYLLGNIEVKEFTLKAENLSSLDESELLQYSCSGETEMDANNSTIKVYISYELLSNSHQLVKTKFLNEFKISNSSNAILLKVHSDQKFIRHIVNLSISHSRGILSYLLKDTKLSKFYIPLSPQIELNPKREGDYVSAI